MTLFKRGDIWQYDFWFLGRGDATPRQTVKADASVCPQEVKARRLRRRSAGLEGPRAAEAPRFQDWAEVHFRERRPQMTQPEFLKATCESSCGSGARPKVDGHPDDRYQVRRGPVVTEVRSGNRSRAYANRRSVRCCKPASEPRYRRCLTDTPAGAVSQHEPGHGGDRPMGSIVRGDDEQ
jgi:hypothetical protein